MTVHSSSDLSGGKINEQNIVFVFYSHVSTVFRHKKKRNDIRYENSLCTSNLVDTLHDVLNKEHSFHPGSRNSPITAAW